MEKKYSVVYPGSFDPPTNGHIDIISRAINLFGNIVIAIITNPVKKATFTVEERVKMLKLCTKKFSDKVEIDTFDGLLVDYLKKKGIKIVIRGLRMLSDFEYEFQMALTNRKLFPSMEIVYLMPDEKWSYVSSSLVKEIAMYNGEFSCFVPREIVGMIKSKFKK